MKLLLITLLIAFLRIRFISSQNVHNCGVPQIVINELIVNGYNTFRGAWPWHVAVHQRHGRIEQYACGGTLVTKQHVITAAHCLRDAEDKDMLSINNIIVKLGVHQLNSTNREIQRRAIRKIHIADDSAQKHLRNDIAILELATEAEFGRYVQPACLSKTEDLTGKMGTVIGWGVDEGGAISDGLKSARLPVVNYFTCMKSDPMMFGAMLDEGIFCAGYTNGTAVCNGDAGGGIFFRENGAWQLGGILSFAQVRDDGSGRCDPNGYAGFTRIHTYLEWIKSVTKL